MNVSYERVDIPDHLIPQKMFDGVVKYDPMMLKFIPDSLTPKKNN